MKVLLWVSFFYIVISPFIYGSNWVIDTELSYPQFLDKYSKHKKNDFSPYVFNPYRRNGELCFSVIWVKDGKERVAELLQAEKFAVHERRFRREGMRPSVVNPYIIGKNKRYLAVIWVRDKQEVKVENFIHISKLTKWRTMFPEIVDMGGTIKRISNPCIENKESYFSVIWMLNTKFDISQGFPTLPGEDIKWDFSYRNLDVQVGTEETQIDFLARWINRFKVSPERMPYAIELPIIGKQHKHNGVTKFWAGNGIKSLFSVKDISSDGVQDWCTKARKFEIRPVSICTYIDVKTPCCYVVWVDNNGHDWNLRWQLTAEQVKKRVFFFAKQNDWMPIDISPYRIGGKVYFSDIWVRRNKISDKGTLEPISKLLND